jgi:hypothetical protein
MDYPVSRFVLPVHHVIKKCWAVIVFCAVVSLIPGTTLRAQGQTQGGTLVFASEGLLSPNDSTYEERIVLVDYVGQPLKALQLRVISSGGFRLRSVERGADIGSPEWNLSHVIVHGQNGFDTAKVVIFGMGRTGLTARPYAEMLTVTYDVVSSSGVTMFFSDVLGALPHGENANVVAGSPRTVALKRK